MRKNGDSTPLESVIEFTNMVMVEVVPEPAADDSGISTLSLLDEEEAIANESSLEEKAEGIADSNDAKSEEEKKDAEESDASDKEEGASSDDAASGEGSSNGGSEPEEIV